MLFRVSSRLSGIEKLMKVIFCQMNFLNCRLATWTQFSNRCGSRPTLYTCQSRLQTFANKSQIPLVNSRSKTWSTRLRLVHAGLRPAHNISGRKIWSLTRQINLNSQHVVTYLAGLRPKRPIHVLSYLIHFSETCSDVIYRDYTEKKGFMPSALTNAVQKETCLWDSSLNASEEDKERAWKQTGDSFDIPKVTAIKEAQQTIVSSSSAIFKYKGRIRRIGHPCNLQGQTSRTSLRLVFDQPRQIADNSRYWSPRSGLRPDFRPTGLMALGLNSSNICRYISVGLKSLLTYPVSIYHNVHQAPLQHSTLN